MTNHEHQSDPFRLPRLRTAAVVLLGLGQAATLIAFVLLVAATADSIGHDMGGVDPAVTPRENLYQLGGLAAVVLLHGCLRAC